MDLKHLKLLKEDDKAWTILDGRDNRSFRVAKKGLSEALSGAIVQRFAEGGEVEPLTAEPEPLVSFVPPAAPLNNSTARAAMLMKQAQAALPPVIPPAAPSAAQPTVAELLAQNNPPLPPPVVLNPEVAQPTPPPVAQPAPQVPMAGGGDFGMGKAYRDAAAAEMAKADVAERKAAEQTVLAQKRMERDSQIASEWDAKWQENEKRVSDMQAQVAAGKVDPSRWWNDQSRGGGLGRKIGASIALLLGGIGGNQQAILGTIMRNIESDIDAQREDLGNKKGLLASYVQQGHDLQSAKRLAMADAASMYASQLEQVSAKYGGKEAKALAQSNIAELKAKAAAARQEVYQRGFQNQLQLLDRMNAAEELRQRNVAAQSKAKEGKELPAETAKQYADLQTLPSVLEDLGKAWDEKTGLLSFVSKHIPGTKTKQYEDQASAAAQVVGTALEGGKLSDFDKQFYRGLMPESTDSAARKQNKLDFLTQLANQRLASQRSVLSQSGYNVPAPVMSKEEAAAAFIRDNPNSELAKDLERLMTKKGA